MRHRNSVTPRSRRLRALLGQGRRERGVAEAAILYPFLLLLVLGAIQLGFYMHAGNVAKAAATVAFNGAHSLEATTGHGNAAVNDFLADHTGELIGATVSITRNATEVSVNVTGQAPGIVPGWSWLNVEGTYTGPVERWTD